MRDMRLALLAIASLGLAELGCSSSNTTSSQPDSAVAPVADAPRAAPDAAIGGPTAYRITSLTIVDPKLWPQAGADCFELSDYVNAAVGSQVNGGAIDALIVFEPLNTTSGMSTLAELIFGDCDDTHLNCSASAGAIQSSLTATSMGSGTCLDVVPGTLTHDSPPTIDKPTGPCFGATGDSATLDLAGLRLDLLQARIGAKWSAEVVPVTLTSGLLYGFITKAQAASVTVPGLGVTLDHLLRGGGSCADGTGSDTDTGPHSESGWYLYMTFSASKVSFVDNR